MYSYVRYKHTVSSMHRFLLRVPVFTARKVKKMSQGDIYMRDGHQDEVRRKQM